jgi:hypothetical protein
MGFRALSLYSLVARCLAGRLRPELHDTRKVLVRLDPRVRVRVPHDDDDGQPRSKGCES